MDPRDISNLEFIQYTIRNKGVSSLQAWYKVQAEYIQKDITRLINEHVSELSNLAFDLSEDLSDARAVLRKFTLKSEIKND